MLLGTRLYRNLLQEARRLPDHTASTYYRDRIRTAFREIQVEASALRAARRTKKAQQLLRQLQAANDGYLHALTRIFETAHGLRGPEKHASLAPFLLRDQQNHTFSPPLAALVGSSISHTSRPPSPSQLVKPPTMPERADLTTEEARLLGPLKPERIRAIKRRWWNLQTGKIRAPVALQLYKDGKEVTDLGGAKRILETFENGMEFVDLEKGQSRLALLEAKARVPTSSRPLPPKRLQTLEQRSNRHPVPAKTARPIVRDSERRTSSPTSRNTKWHNPKQITGRLLRRRAAESLEIAPIVEVHVNGNKKPTYEVARSRFAKSEKGNIARISEEDLHWLQRGEGQRRHKSKK
ncbi:uncharacterized protein JCM6883_007598 [Sporobolomyces salmoneus]|uniref:uncharacterized protein n=1 Tax=Sporobolomyces salmoneus TaxID=183962 RepID=UPI00316BE3B2